MGEYINPASNISYTLKDFLTIFPELLTLTNQLTNRWDPSLSNESDPGRVLLLLNAILADKLNYNIDKNILEAFPLSLTLMSSARKIYNMLGYRMSWYKSAQTVVSILWKGLEESSDKKVVIPAFTQISDESSQLIYSLIGPAKDINTDYNLNVSDIVLTFDNSLVDLYVALLGVSVTYDINGVNVIRASDLDSLNRLYFSTTDVAENGVFICNVVSDSNYNVYDWKRVDNLLVEKLGLKNFEFGITDDLYSCYIQFPEDAENLIRDGIQIVYIRTLGKDGNTSSKQICKFKEDLSLHEILSDSPVILSDQNVIIQNIIPGSGGKNPETIDEAYINYKRTAGTFDTLVTLRDYTNAMLQSGLCSNGFVTDRTNDPLCSYTVKSTVNGVDTNETVVERINVEKTGYSLEDDRNELFLLSEDALSPIDMKLYALSLSNIIYDSDNINNYYPSYQLSFIFEDVLDSDDDPIKSYLALKKHIGTTYKNIQVTTDQASRVCMFKNKYNVNARITCKCKITDSDKLDIRRNIINSFYKNLNAYKVKFGENISVDRITSIIEKSDNRIKSVYVDTLTYDTFAVYRIESVICPFCKKKLNSTKWLRNAYKCDNIIDHNTLKQCGFLILPDTWKDLIKVENGGDIIYVEEKINTDDSISYTSNYTCPIFNPDTLIPYMKGDLVLWSPDPSTILYSRYRCLKDNVYNFDSVGTWKKDEYNFNINYNKFTGSLSKYSYEENLKFTNGVKYEANLLNPIESNKNTILKEKEFIVFYIKNDNNSYYYYAFGSGSCINSSFKLLTTTTHAAADLFLPISYKEWDENQYDGKYYRSLDSSSQYEITDEAITKIDSISLTISGSKHISHMRPVLDLSGSGLLEYGPKFRIYVTHNLNNKLSWAIDNKGHMEPLTNAQLDEQYGIKWKNSDESGSLYHTPGSLSAYDYIDFEISKSTLIKDEVYAKSILAGKTPITQSDEKYMDYSFLSPCVEFVSDVSSAQGDTTISFKKNNGFQYDMQKNEIIEFYSTDFVDSVKYDTFVKYEAKLNSDIQCGSDRQLGDDEYIIFYYRPSDNPTGIYLYHAYGKGTVINSTINISASKVTNKYAALLLPSLDNWKVTLSAGHTYREFYTEFGGQMSIELSNNIYDYLTTQVLDVSDSITIKQPILISLDDKYYCYWILNSKVGNEYILFNRNDLQRILENGEYFIYFDQSFTQRTVLGLGTRIYREFIDSYVSVTSNISYITLLSNEISKYKDRLFHPTHNNPFICALNLMTYLSNGCQIKLVAKPDLTLDDVPSIINVTKDGIESLYFLDGDGESNIFSIDNHPSEVLLVLVNNEQVDYNYDPINFELEILNIIPDKGKKNIAVHVGLVFTTYKNCSEPTFMFYLSDEKPDAVNSVLVNGLENINYIYDSTNYLLQFGESVVGDITILYTKKLIDNPFNYFDILYNKQGETEFKNKLSTFLSNSDNNLLLWNALTILNLEISKTQGQVLYANLRLVLYDSVGNIIKTVYGKNSETIEVKGFSDKSNPYTYVRFPVYIYSDANISTSTSGRYSVYTDTSDSATFSIANYIIGSDSEYMTVYSSGDADIVIPDELELKDTAILPVRLPAGEYLMRLSQSSKEIDRLNMWFADADYLKIEGTDVIMMTSSSRELSRSNKTSVTFKIPDDYDRLELFLVANIGYNIDISEPIKISLGNPMKFVYNENINKDKVKSYLQLVKKLDVNDHYNYMYQISDNELIVDPLAPSSFLNYNHPFYKYTICEYDGFIDDIQVLETTQ